MYKSILANLQASIISLSVALSFAINKFSFIDILNKIGSWFTIEIDFLKLSLFNLLNIVVFPTPLSPTIAFCVCGFIEIFIFLKTSFFEVSYLNDKFSISICPFIW